MSTANYCRSCGAQLSPEYKFCAVCGAPLGEGPPPAVPPEPSGARKMPMWPFIAAGAFIVAAALIGAMFLLRPQDKDENAFAERASSASEEEEREEPERTEKEEKNSRTPKPAPAPADAEVPKAAAPRTPESVWRNALTDFLSRRTGLFEDMDVLQIKYHSDYKDELIYLEDGVAVDFDFELCDVSGNGVPELLLVRGIPQTDAVGWFLYEFDGEGYSERGTWSEYPEFYRDSEGRTVVIAGPSALTDGFEASYLEISNGGLIREEILDKDGYCPETGKAYQIYDWESYGPDGAAWLTDFTADYGLAPIPRTSPEDVWGEALLKSGITPNWRDEYAKFLIREGVGSFFLYDFDDDGIPELIFSDDGYVWNVYGYKNGSVIEIPADDGTLYFGHASFEYDNPADGLRGIICADGGSGGMYYFLYYLEGGSIKSMNIFDIPNPRGEEPPEFLWSAAEHYQDGTLIPGLRPQPQVAGGGVNIPFYEAEYMEDDLLSGEALVGYGAETGFSYYDIGNRLYAPGGYE